MFVFILIYVALTIIRPQDYMPQLEELQLLPVTLMVSFAFWIASSAKTFAAPQFLILPVFLLALMVSQVTNGWSGGALEQLKQFGPTVIAFFVLATAVSVSQRRVVIALAVFTLCSMVLALHGVDQARNGVGWTGMGPSADGRIQYIGIFNDPNDLGLLFVTAVPMALYLSSRGALLGRLLWLAGAALLLYGVYLTNSRGAMLAVLVVGGVYIWRHRGMATAAVLGVIGLTGMKLLSSRMQELDVDESSAFGRVDAWYEGLHMFMSRPLFGIGAGNFTEYNYLTAHNSFVLVLAETGLFGYITWLAFIGYGFWMMIAVLRKPVEPVAEDRAAAWQGEQRIAMTLLLSLCGMFAAAFFLSRSYTIVLYLLAALVTGYYVGARKRFPELPPLGLGDGWWRWVPMAAVSIIGLFILVAVLMHSA